MYSLYKITNTVNTKVYIGVTSDPKRRWWQHQRQDSACTKLRRAMNKHGVGMFSLEVVCVGTEEFILELEPQLIAAYDSVRSGYNIQNGGADGYGFSPVSRVTDKPVYVAGFWFPSTRCSLTTLDMKKGTFQARKKAGTLGDTYVSRATKTFKVANPVFARGFWFSTVHIASSTLHITINAVHTIYRKEKINVG